MSTRIIVLLTLLLAALLAPMPAPADGVAAAPACGAGWPGSGLPYQPALATDLCASTIVIDGEYASLLVCGDGSARTIYPIWRSWPELHVMGGIAERPSWDIDLTHGCQQIDIHGRWRGDVVPDLSNDPMPLFDASPAELLYMPIIDG